MGLFSKLFGSGATGSNSAKPKEEPKTNINDPREKDLAWFSSEAGLEALKAYTTPQGYTLEESIEKEKESKHPDYSLGIVIDVFHKDAKVPYTYFNSLVRNIKAQPLEYVGPIELLIKVLSVQAQPFYLDDDGEPQAKETEMKPAEIVSVERNPVLNFVSNFNCFLLKDDEKGSWEDKWHLYSLVLIFLGFESSIDADVLAKNGWIFEPSTYFNDLGTVRKEKGFIKKAIELSSDKNYFEDKLKDFE
jgi:hypothetical protein